MTLFQFFQFFNFSIFLHSGFLFALFVYLSFSLFLCDYFVQTNFETQFGMPFGGCSKTYSKACGWTWVAISACCSWLRAWLFGSWTCRIETRRCACVRPANLLIRAQIAQFPGNALAKSRPKTSAGISVCTRPHKRLSWRSVRFGAANGMSRFSPDMFLLVFLLSNDDVLSSRGSLFLICALAHVLHRSFTHTQQGGACEGPRFQRGRGEPHSIQPDVWLGQNSAKPNACRIGTIWYGLCVHFFATFFYFSLSFFFYTRHVIAFSLLLLLQVLPFMCLYRVFASDVILLFAFCFALSFL